MTRYEYLENENALLKNENALLKAQITRLKRQLEDTQNDLQDERDVNMCCWGMVKDKEREIVGLINKCHELEMKVQNSKT